MGSRSPSWLEVKDNDGALWQELIATITGGTMTITRHARLENRRVSLLLIFEMMRFIDEMRSGSATAPFMRPIPAQSRPWTRIHYPQSHLGMWWDSTPRDEQELPIWEAPMMTEEQGIGAMQSAALGGPCTRIDGSCDMHERKNGRTPSTCLNGSPGLCRITRIPMPLTLTFA